MNRPTLDAWPKGKWWRHAWAIHPERATRILREVLAQTHSIPAAAKAIGVSRKTLFSWMKRAELREGLDLPKVGRPRRHVPLMRPSGRVSLESCEPSANSTT